MDMADELAKVTEESARGGFFLISGSAIATVIMAVASILVTRFLGSDLYGQYTLALVVPQLLFLFTDLGVSQGVTKFTAYFKMKADTHQIRKIIKYGLLLRASAGIAISVVTYLFADTLATFLIQRPDLALYVQIASLSILPQVIFTTANSAFVGLDKTEFSALTANANAIAKAIVSITLVLLGYSVIGAIAGYVLGYVVAAVASGVLVFLLVRGKGESKGEGNVFDGLKTMLHYGFPLYLSILFAGFIPLYNEFILSYFTTYSDVGNYKAAVNFVSLMAVLTIPITTALLPAFSKLNSLSVEKVRAFYRLAKKYTAIVIVPITFLIIIFSKEVVEITYGSTFESTSLFLSTYCLLYFLVGIGYLVLPSLYNGLGETRVTFEMSLITFLMLAVQAPFLTTTYGVQGLITAFLVASAVGTLYGLGVARKKFQVTFDALTLLKVYLVSAVSCVSAVVVLYVVYHSLVFKIVVGGFSYLFLYVTLLAMTKTVTLAELNKASSIAGKTLAFAIVAKPVLWYMRKLARFKQDS
jgi:O-antigen/teichoic acid export membrane protein